MDDQELTAWQALGPIQPSPLSAPRPRPSAKTLEIAGKLGLRFPPANAVDREAHAARVALLAEDCADIDPVLLDEAARDWSQREPFFPRTCELRELALAIGRVTRTDRLLLAPKAETPKPPPQPPLTDEEIAKLPGWLVSLGVSVGDIEPERAERLQKAPA